MMYRTCPMGTHPRPQPDSCTRYVATIEAEAHSPPRMIPYSRGEDGVAKWCVALLSFPVNAMADFSRYGIVHHSDMHFPLATAQWRVAVTTNR